MHGQVKVRMSQEQKNKLNEVKKKESDEFTHLVEEVLAKRSSGDFSLGILDSLSNLLEKCCEMNTLWNYRREILLNPKNSDLAVETKAKTFDAELTLTAKCLLHNPKSYATWHYRSWVMANHPSPDWKAELNLCNFALKSDDRNFHCWDYRRFVVKNSKIPHNDELDFASLTLEENFSNYSAWHYRSELLGVEDPVCTAATPVSPPPCFDLTHVDKSSGSSVSGQSLPWNELDLVHNAIFTDPKDQGPWFYYWWLLSRGENNSYLRELYLSRILQRVVLVFTAPKLSSAISHLQVDVVVTDTTTNEIQRYNPSDLGGWRSALEDTAAAVWWFELPKEYTEQRSVTVTVFVEGSEKSTFFCGSNSTNPKVWLNCRIEEDQSESLTRVALDPRRLLNPMLSPVHEPSALMSELDTVKELLSIEPNNKWALLTFVSLLRYIRPEHAENDIRHSLTVLQEVDTQRARYYDDMASAHATEDALINAYATNSRILILSGVHLTRICCLDWCSLMTELDFSSNQLDFLPGTFAYLVCLTKLNLDDNRITHLKPVSSLPLLNRISICRNAISEFEGLEPVLSCPRLRNLDVTGNDVVQLPHFTTLLAEHPGSKRSHHSLNVIYNKPVNTP